MQQRPMLMRSHTMMKQKPSMTTHAKTTKRQLFVGTIGTLALGSTASRAQSSDNAIVPFSYRASDEALADLRRRLEQTRWPESETGTGWEQGPPLSTLKQLVYYWRAGYNWQRCQSELNQWPQFKTTIDGLGIHFIHVRSRHPNPLPIILKSTNIQQTWRRRDDTSATRRTSIAASGQHDSSSKNRLRGPMACCAKETARAREGAHQALRPRQRRAASTADGEDREGLCVRRPRRKAQFQDTLRGPPPAHHLSLHVRSGVGQGMSELHVVHRLAG